MSYNPNWSICRALREWFQGNWKPVIKTENEGSKNGNVTLVDSEIKLPVDIQNYKMVTDHLLAEDFEVGAGETKEVGSYDIEDFVALSVYCESPDTHDFDIQIRYRPGKNVTTAQFGDEIKGERLARRYAISKHYAKTNHYTVEIINNDTETRKYNVYNARWKA